MCRPYSSDEFHARVELINRRLDRPAITTDIIVGFPTETNADFERTLSVAREVAFAKMHVFPFSPRQGTAAARLPDGISPQVVKERSQILRHLDQELQYQFRNQFLGQTAQVLIETTNTHPSGRAERYFMVHLTDSPLKPDNNQIITIKIQKNTPNAALASAHT